MKKSSIVVCVLLSGFMQGCLEQNSRPLDQYIYLIDMQRGELCTEHTRECYNFSLIGPSYNEVIIAKAYGLGAKTFSWGGRELAELMLNPPKQQYQVQTLSEGKYRLPGNHATHSVWDVLALEYYILYERDDDALDNLLMRPIPRRFQGR